jgi:hypothetical protein
MVQKVAKTNAGVLFRTAQYRPGEIQYTTAVDLQLYTLVTKFSTRINLVRLVLNLVTFLALTVCL